MIHGLGRVLRGRVIIVLFGRLSQLLALEAKVECIGFVLDGGPVVQIWVRLCTVQPAGGSVVTALWRQRLRR
jgi:hypothetical protein